MSGRRPEALLERQVLQALGRNPDLALFKNECGEGFYGNVRGQIKMLPATSVGGQVCVRRDDVLAILDRSRVHYGLHVGSADIVGVVAVEVTPAMVGRTLGRFVSLELKSDSGVLRPEQELWRARMIELGAVAGVARSPGEAAVMVEQGRR